MLKNQLTRRILWSLLVLAVMSVPAFVSANWLGGITFDHASPSYLPHSELVTVTIDCKVDSLEGARIHVMPFSSGQMTPNLVSDPGTLVPEGQSTVTRTFGVTSGNHTVDQVRIRMTNAQDTMVLLEFFLPVEYIYGPYGMFNIQIEKSEYSVLARGEDLYIDFDFGSPGPDNVIVFIRPFFDGSPVIGYSSGGGRGGSPSGSASLRFNFGTPPKDINQVHFKMTNADQSVILLEFDLPVHYFWRAIGISNYSFSRPSPSPVHNSELMEMTFDYYTQLGGGGDILLLTEPYFNGSLVTGGFPQTRPVIPSGSGSDIRRFGSTGTTYVNQVRLLATTPDQSVTFIDILIPVEYEFRPNVVYNITMEPAAPMKLDFDEMVNVNFDYHKDAATNVDIFAAPYHDGFAVQPVGFIPTASHSAATGSGTYRYKIYDNSNYFDVNRLKIRMNVENSTSVLSHYYFSLNQEWGPSTQATPVPNAGPSRSRILGQNYPNPFNPSTSIPVELTTTGRVVLEIFDIRGRLLRTVADKVMTEGRHEIIFDGSGLPSGQYYYRLQGSGQVQTRTMTLVK